MQSADNKIDEELLEKINTLRGELDKMAPNMRAVERLGDVEERLKSTDQEFEEARIRAKKAKEEFAEVKQQRSDLFNKAFSHISDQIGPIYKDLTRSTSMPIGGQA